MSSKLSIGVRSNNWSVPIINGTELTQASYVSARFDGRELATIETRGYLTGVDIDCIALVGREGTSRYSLRRVIIKQSPAENLDTKFIGVESIMIDGIEITQLISGFDIVMDVNDGNRGRYPLVTYTENYSVGRPLDGTGTIGRLLMIQDKEIGNTPGIFDIRDRAIPL